MWLSFSISALIGLVAGRAIVAEASAHRRNLPDRWWDPLCEVCDTSLNVTMNRCRGEAHRQSTASWLTPLVTAALFGVVSLAVPSLAVLPAYLVFSGTMVLLTLTDLDTKLIPNRILGPATIIASGLLIVGGIISGERFALLWAVVGGTAYFGVMFILALISRGGLGFGDVKMSFLIGIFAGYLSLGHVVVAGVGAFLLGGVVALVLLATRRSSRKDSIPFGPFMTVAGIGAVLLGDAIIAWYIG